MEQAEISSLLWEEGKKIFYEEIGNGKAEKLKDNTSLKETVESLQVASGKASREYGEHSIRKDKKPVITIQLRRIMQRLQILMEIGDAYMEAAPETVSLVWMSFRMIFTGFLKDSETCAFLTDAVDQISDIMFICNVFEKRYLKENKEKGGETAIKDRILSQIPPLYASVLKFSYQARRLFAHGKLIRSIMQWRSTELEDTLGEAQAKRNVLQDTVRIDFQEAVLDTLEGMQIDVALVRGVSVAIHSEVVPGIRKIQSEQSRTKEAKRREDIEKKYREQLEWIKSGGVADLKVPGQILDTIRSATHPGTVDWILSNKEYILWQSWRSNSEGALCWIHGHGGFGKSFLVSSIIDHLDSDDRFWPQGKPHILYFFCRRGDEITSSGTKIFLHLLMQLYDKASPESPDSSPELQEQCSQVIEEAWRKLKSHVRHDSSLVKLKPVLQPIFEDLVEVFTKNVYIIVDGLDECIDLDLGLADVLTDLSKEPNVRVLLASRPEALKEGNLGSHYSITVSAETTQQQIAKYVKSRVKAIKRFTPKMRKQACIRIAEQSQGSFRYAKVVTDSLNSPKNIKTPFAELIESLPKGMDALYRQAMANLNPELRTILVVALRWCVCSEDPVTLDLIVDEVEGKWELDDDNDDDQNAEDDDANDSDYDDFKSDAGDEPQVEAESTSFGEYYDRKLDIPKELKFAGRDFLRFDEEYVELQHESVRDFVLAEENAIEQSVERCPECKKRFQETIAYEAGPKHGLPILCRTVLRRLNNPKFQREYILAKDHDEHEEAVVDDEERNGRGNQGVDKSIHHLRDVVLSWQNRRPSSGSPGRDSSRPRSAGERGRSPQPSPATRPVLVRPIDDDDDDDASSSSGSDISVPDGRYEVIYWPYLFQNLEEQIQGKEEKEDSTKLKNLYDCLDEDQNIRRLYDDLEKFMNPNSEVYKHWFHKVQPDMPPERVDNPLMVAAQYGVQGLVWKYLQQKTYDINEKNADGHTPLHLACSVEAYGTTISILCAHGANVEARNNVGETPLLRLLALGGENEDVQVLLNHGAKPDVADNNGMTPLHHAAQLVDTELCKILLSYPGVEVNAKESTSGETPLHRAFRWNFAPPDLLELLILKGANVNQEDNDSQTPLYEACESGDAASVALLLKHGAKIDDVENVYGNTPLLAAIAKSSLPTVKVLVEAGADLQLKNKQGEDPVAAAVDVGSLSVFEYLLDVYIKKGLVAEKAVQRTALQQQTPLHLAAAGNHWTIAKKLLDSGSPSNLLSQKDRSGNTPLHTAAERCSLDIVLLFLKHGADASIKNVFDQSPLALAALAWSRNFTLATADYDQEEVIGTVVALVEKAPDTAPLPLLLNLDIETEVKTPICKIYANHHDLADEHGWTPIALARRFNRDYKLKPLIQGSQGELPNTIGKPPTKLQRILPKKAPVVLSEDGLELSTERVTGDVVAEILSDHPVPSGTSPFYFEVEILEAPTKLKLSVSLEYIFEPTQTSLMNWGWLTSGAVASVVPLPGDKDRGLSEYLKPFGKGYTIGCGIDLVSNALYFTRDGVRLPITHRNLYGRLYPSVEVKSPGVKLRVNFGNDPMRPFKFQEWATPPSLPKTEEKVQEEEEVLEISFETLKQRPPPVEEQTPITPLQRSKTWST